MKAFSGQRSKWQDVSILYLDGATVTDLMSTVGKSSG